MKKLSEKVLSFDSSPIRKFIPLSSKAEEDGKRIYYLNIGQPDIKTPDVFMEAIRGFKNEVIEYAPSGGLSVLKNSLVDYYKGYNMDYNQEDLIITCGGSEALSMVMTALCNEGDNIITPEPYYANYKTFINASGGMIRPITTKAENGYHYAEKKMIEPLIGQRTKAILVSNPANPTGTVLMREQMELILQLALKHDIFLIADEVYREFVYDGLKRHSFGQFSEFAERIILIDSVSKRFSACGARIGSVATKNKVLLGNLMKIAQVRLSVSTLDQVGSAALYGLPKSYYDEVRSEYEKRRNITYEELSKIDGIVCEKPRGAFYIMAQLPVDNAEEFLVWMLEDFSDGGETVLFSPGEGFYATEGIGKNEIRIACMLNVNDMKRGVELIRLGLEKYKGR